MFSLVKNKRLISLFFFLLLSLKGFSSSSIISHRTFLKLVKPGIVNCERTDELIVDCESSTSIVIGKDTLNDPIKSFSHINENKIRFNLNDKSWEFFGFSKPGVTNRYILDFWKKKTKASKKLKVSRSLLSDSLKIKKSGQKKRLVKSNKRTNVVKKINNKVKHNPDLDFRYGSLFFWNLEPLSPEIKMSFNYRRKTPDQIIKLNEREVEKSDEEAHLQLTLNLFKSMKWGLMYKSIDLFNQKYPQTKNNDFNEFLKLNSLIKERYINGKTFPTKEIVKRLDLFTQTSQNAKFNMAIYEYLLSYHIDKKNIEDILKTATSLYVLSKKNYFPEKMTKSLELVIHALSIKGDVDKISKLLKDNEVHKFLSKHKIREFDTYTKLRRNKSEELVSEYERSKKGIVGNLPRTLLYNLGEAYFRQGNYKKSIKLYDKFLKNHSKDISASKARLRIALCYELLGKDLNLVSKLYRNAIDRGSDVLDRFEASIRYVGVALLRKKDRISYSEAESFLNIPKGISSTAINGDVKKILWLTRLRSLIVAGKLGLAKDYFYELPLDKISFEDRKVFFGDFSEILLGLMHESFNKKNHSEVIKLFSELEKTENTYVPIRSAHYFIEAASYLSLGVEKSSESSLIKAKKISDTNVYPNWISKSINNQIKHTIKVVRFNLELANKKYSDAINIANGISDNQLRASLLLKVLEKKKDYKNYIQKIEDFYLGDLDKGISKERNSDLISHYIFSLIMDGDYIKAKKVLLSSALGTSESWITEKNEFSLLNLIEFFSSPRHSDKEFQKLVLLYGNNFSKGKWRGKVNYIVAKRELRIGNEKKVLSYSKK